MRNLLFAVVAVLISSSVLADGILDNTPLNRKEWFDTLPTLPPLNTPLLYGRLTTNELKGTGNIMALIYEQGATPNTVFPWPLYVQLDTSHDRGGATGVNSRYISRGAGWGVSLHGEGIAYGNATVIGSNLEMSPMTGSQSRVIGLNLQAKDGYGPAKSKIWSNHAINIQSEPAVGWNEGIRFDSGSRTINGIYFDPNSRGQRAIYVDSANYLVGIDTGAAPTAVRMKAGSKVCLEATGVVCVRYNPTNHRIEFLHGENSLGYISTGIFSNKCLNCPKP